MNHPEAGVTVCYGPPIRIRGTSVNARPAPMLGEHNGYVFGQILKLTAQQVDDLAGRKII